MSAREHSRSDLLDKQKQRMSERKLKFNITYYPAFRNARSIMEELHILLTPNKEHKKIFPDVPVAGFRNGKSFKDYLVTPKLSKLDKSEPCGEKTCLVCDSISTTTTFTTEVCQETFKIQKGPLNCDSEKVLYLLKCTLRKQKPKSEHLERVTKKFLRNVFALTIVSMAINWNFVIFEQCETHEHLNKKINLFATQS